MALVVFGASISLLVVYLHGEQASTQRNSAQDGARLAIDRISRQLRNIASPIPSPRLVERATDYDLVFQTVGTPTASNAGGRRGSRTASPRILRRGIRARRS
jgi:hypothetical protein